MFVFLCLFSLAAATTYPAPSCGENETYKKCYQPGCPNIYCPVDRNQGFMSCDAVHCDGGCGCLPNYKRLSVHDERCIPASECPPNECGENEEWNPCTDSCFTDSCAYKDNKFDCQRSSQQNCNPRCVCRPGFYRTDDNICVTGDQCPPVYNWGSN